MTVADHVQKVLKSNFGAAWEEVGGENELEDTYALSYETLQGGIIMTGFISSFATGDKDLQRFRTI